MEGFTSRGIVVLPPKEVFRSLSETDRGRFAEAVRLLPEVFQSNYGIELFYFNTNVIYGLPMPETMRPVYCLCRGDIDYLNGIVKSGQFYELVRDDKEQFKQDEYEELRERVRKRNPFKRGASVNARVRVIEKRECELARLIAQKFTFVISFENDGNQRYGLKTKKMDGRILIEIELPALTARGFLSGETINIVSLMNRPWAYKRVSQWEAGK